MGHEKFELRREFESDDAKIAALTHTLLNWDFKLPRDVFHNISVACRNIDAFRVSHVMGGSASATRDDRHYALDGQDFISVVADEQAKREQSRSKKAPKRMGQKNLMFELQ